jgi:hypothetical protein
MCLIAQHLFTVYGLASSSSMHYMGAITLNIFLKYFRISLDFQLALFPTIKYALVWICRESSHYLLIIGNSIHMLLEF